MTARIERIRPHWDWIRPYLEELIDDNPAMRGLMPEDIFHACEAGEAFCVVADEGFVISLVETDPTTGEKNLFIWVAVAREPGNDCVTKYMPFFQQLAKELGCAYISTKTPYSAVGDHLEACGWDKTVTEYTTAVT